MPPPANGHITPTHQRMLSLLSDGQAHTLAQLHSCLNDELAEERTVHVHLTYLRKYLRLKQQGILCERDCGTPYFRLVRFLAGSSD